MRTTFSATLPRRPGPDRAPVGAHHDELRVQLPGGGVDLPPARALPQRRLHLESGPAGPRGHALERGLGGLADAVRDLGGQGDAVGIAELGTSYAWTMVIFAPSLVARSIANESAFCAVSLKS